MTGFINAIKQVMLEDGSGTSASDGLSTNAVGSEKVAGLGVPPRGEPGVTHRRRKRDAFKSPADRKLYRKVMQGGEPVEMSDAGMRRFGLFEKVEGECGATPHPS
jgi:hypothetical protein